MKKLLWRTVQKRVNDLTPQKNNPRKITDKQMSDLQKNLKRFNLVEIPAVDTDGKILAGHQRIKALQLLDRGEEIIDVRMPNRKLTKAESDRYLIASNAIGGDWDFEKLKSFDLDLITDFENIDLAKFWDKDLEVQEDDFNEKEELAKIKEPKTKLGDLILLGKHKLICGDSTDPAVLKRLFGDEKASMIYSDPIYNLRIDYNKGIGGKQNYGGNVNDNRSYDEYKEFLRKSLVNALAVSKKDTHVFYWSDQTLIGVIQELYRDMGIENKRVCLWLKNGFNLTPGVAFNKCYEPCTYGVRGRPYIAKDINNLNEVLNKELTTGNSLLNEALDNLDLWMVKRLAGKDYSHATSKPPKLHEKALRRCTRPGDIILDSFSGSASTMIAAEQLKRRVFAVELEETFCDLAIRRWEKLTGGKAKIIRN